MSLTPVGARLFLEGIDWTSGSNHIIATVGEREFMIVEDAYLASDGEIGYNVALLGTGAGIHGASADEVVEFIKLFVADNDG